MQHKTDAHYICTAKKQTCTQKNKRAHKTEYLSN